MVSRAFRPPAVQVPEQLTLDQIWAVRMRRLERRHAHWRSCAHRSLAWETWPLSMWMRLVEAVKCSLGGGIRENLMQAPAKPILNGIALDFEPPVMTKDGRADVTAQSPLEMAALLDDGFRPQDAYLLAFTRTLRCFLIGILLRTLSASSVAIAEREMRGRNLTYELSVVFRDVRKGSIPVCPVSSVTKLRGLVLCLRVIRPAALMPLDPRSLPSEDAMDYIRLANTALHTLLFDRDMSGERAVGLMYFFSAVENECPEARADFIQVAQVLLQA